MRVTGHQLGGNCLFWTLSFLKVGPQKDNSVFWPFDEENLFSMWTASTERGLGHWPFFWCETPFPRNTQQPKLNNADSSMSDLTHSEWCTYVINANIMGAPMSQDADSEEIAFSAPLIFLKIGPQRDNSVFDDRNFLFYIIMSQKVLRRKKKKANGMQREGAETETLERVSQLSGDKSGPHFHWPSSMPTVHPFPHFPAQNYMIVTGQEGFESYGKNKSIIEKVPL